MVNGYYLNNELTDFSFEPAKDGCPVANRVGHADVRTLPPGTCKANAIELLGDRWVGGADPRSEGAALSQ
jgi:gamma-glutamyltranspeptidase